MYRIGFTREYWYFRRYTFSNIDGNQTTFVQNYSSQEQQTGGLVIRREFNRVQWVRSRDWHLHPLIEKMYDAVRRQSRNIMFGSIINCGSRRSWSIVISFETVSHHMDMLGVFESVLLSWQSEFLKMILCAVCTIGGSTLTASEAPCGF